MTMHDIKHKRRPNTVTATPADCLQWIMDHLDHNGEECLTWPFSIDLKGYGRLTYKGASRIASRVMCTFVHGEPPTPRHHAAHKCGKGHLACVHPEHVRWRTPLQNRIEANEHGTGNQKAPRRLTYDQVELIRVSPKSSYDLAAEYGVHQDTIAQIRRGETWTKPRSTLTGEQLRRIKEMHAAGHRQIDIARALGLPHHRVHKTITNQAYRGN